MSVDVDYLNSNANAIAEVAEAIAKDDSHGYDQSAREGNGTVDTVMTDHFGDVEVPGGDMDCASMVDVVLDAVGVTKTPGQPYSTREEEEALLAAGFTKFPYDPDNVQRGDVLFRDYYDADGDLQGHTGIALGDGKQADASHGDGYLGITGTEGDQDGTEVLVRDLQDDWEYVFRPPAGQPDLDFSLTQEETETLVQESIEQAFGTGLDSFNKDIEKSVGPIDTSTLSRPERDHGYTM